MKEIKYLGDLPVEIQQSIQDAVGATLHYVKRLTGIYVFYAEEAQQVMIRPIQDPMPDIPVLKKGSKKTTEVPVQS